MYETPLTFSRLETALLLVCVSLLAAAGLYAWLVCELMNRNIMAAAGGPDGLIMNGLQVFPLLFLFALAGGFGCGALVSVTLRRQGFMDAPDATIKYPASTETKR
ncbi:hypothetical protein [Pantoea sp. At-9b]|uniref:hypothetical protein n=1 Tax=Pantoea sp. (strain At-9b) TaxID=592316 RepID=UPI0001B3F892|nr:hypothetical protein [Pantoea sp. At-9b]ADU73068.1 hypothetical protein Pat9b_4088 [Pantoea sp. At-9b]